MLSYKKTDNKKNKRPYKMKYEVGSGNVFLDIGFNPAEANEKFLKCQLMIEIEKIIKNKGWTQEQAAKKLGVVQPRISEIRTTRMERFTIDMLIKYLNKLGKGVHVTIADLQKSA